jgi:hypothetical protein
VSQRSDAANLRHAKATRHQAAAMFVAKQNTSITQPLMQHFAYLTECSVPRQNKRCHMVIDAEGYKS